MRTKSHDQNKYESAENYKRYKKNGYEKKAQDGISQARNTKKRTQTKETE